MDQGKTEEGLEVLSQAAKVNKGWKYFGYGPALIQSGRLQEGKAIIRELEDKEPSAFSALCLAMMYVNLKDHDKTFEWLQFEKKHAWYPGIRIMIDDTEVLRDPRFLELMREMNLPDPAPLVLDHEV